MRATPSTPDGPFKKTSEGLRVGGRRGGGMGSCIQGLARRPLDTKPILANMDIVIANFSEAMLTFVALVEIHLLPLPLAS